MEILKQKLDLKTVFTCVVFIVGLVANNIKAEYTQKLALKDVENNVKLWIKDLENKINIIENKINKN